MTGSRGPWLSLAGLSRQLLSSPLVPQLPATLDFLPCPSPCTSLHTVVQRLLALTALSACTALRRHSPTPGDHPSTPHTPFPKMSSPDSCDLLTLSLLSLASSLRRPLLPPLYVSPKSPPVPVVLSGQPTRAATESPSSLHPQLIPRASTEQAPSFAAAFIYIPGVLSPLSRLPRSPPPNPLRIPRIPALPHFFSLHTPHTPCSASAPYSSTPPYQAPPAFPSPTMLPTLHPIHALGCALPACQELAQCSPPGHPSVSLRGLWSSAASSCSPDPTRGDCSVHSPPPRGGPSHTLRIPQPQACCCTWRPSGSQPLPVYPYPRASPQQAHRPPHREASPSPC